MNGRIIPARHLPLPKTVSLPLADTIAQPLEPCLALVLDAPEGLADWDSYAARFAEGADERIARFVADYRCTIAEDSIGGVRVYRVTPASLDDRKRERLLVHLHGGAFVVGGGRFGLAEAILVAHHSGTPVLSIDYRLAPHHPFPAALDDAVAVWRALVAEHAVKGMAIFGTSAGGALALSLCLAAKNAGLPLPAALAPSTPWSDLAEIGDSYFTNRFVDGAAPTYEGLLAVSARLYAGNHNMADPLLSPVYGDFAGFPPVLLFTGTRDLFLSNTVRVHRRMRQAGVAAHLHVFEGISHGQLNALDTSPETLDAMAELTKFMDDHLA